MLEAFGLDATTEAVYRAMLAEPHLGVAGLARHLGIQESRVRSALDQLSELSLVRPSREEQGRLLPVAPDIGLSPLIQAKRAELHRQERDMLACQEAIDQLLADATPAAGASPYVERLIGLDAIQSRLETLAKQCSRECLSVMPGGAQTAANLEAGKPLNDEALRRGVEIRTLYQASVRNDPPTLAYASWLIAKGGEVRTTPLVPPRMLVFDRQTALLPLDPSNTSRGAVLVSEIGIVAASVSLFELTWRDADPIEAPPSPDQDSGLTSQERDLLRLLSQGLTDEAAAKRLGVSLRTVRRMMASIMERLDSTSRFQAGCAANERGWL